MKKIIMMAAAGMLLSSTMVLADAPAKAATCNACHGADFKTSLMPIYPKLAGQNKEYLVNAINAYKAGERTGTNAGMMTPMVSSLTDEEIEELTTYIAGLPAQ
jgi:cytochrome c553